MALNRILFAFAPLFVKWNHGIALLSAICKTYAIDTALYLLDTPERFKQFLESQDYDCVAFSAVTRHDFELSLPFMQVAKDMGLLTLLGGVYPRRGTPFHAPIDHVCRGEAEEALPLFLMTGDSQYLDNIDVCGDLNELPIPDYELFKGIPYNREIPSMPGAKIVPYVSSRGCPYRCHFCEVSLQTPEIRIRTKVEDDLMYLRAMYHPDVFALGDELPPYYNPKWRESWGNFHHPFVCYVRGDIAPAHLTWLYDHGMKGCFFGVESGNEDYRNNVLGKKLTDKDIRRTVGLLKEMKTTYMASYMVGAPGETWEMMGQTAKMREELSGIPITYQYENLMGA